MTGRPKEPLAMNELERDVTGTAVYGTVRTVVWEDGGCKLASYPIREKVHIHLLAVSFA